MTDYDRLQIAIKALKRIANPMLAWYDLPQPFDIRHPCYGPSLTAFLRDPATYKKIADAALREIKHETSVVSS